MSQSHRETSAFLRESIKENLGPEDSTDSNLNVQKQTTDEVNLEAVARKWSNPNTGDRKTSRGMSGMSDLERGSSDRRHSSLYSARDMKATRDRAVSAIKKAGAPIKLTFTDLNYTVRRKTTAQEQTE